MSDTDRILAAIDQGRAEFKEFAKDGGGRPLRIDLHVHKNDGPDQSDTIIQLLHAVLDKEVTLVAIGQDILQGITDEGTVIDSVLALLQGLIDNQTIPAGVGAQIMAQISKQKDALNAAILKNTPQDTGGGGTGGATALAGGTVGVSYSAALTAAAGTGPWTWAAASGATPDGTALSSDGNVGGIPMTAGAFAFGAIPTDSTGVAGAEQKYTITVA